MHGSFGRGDTLNFTAAIGPDFKAGYVDPLPVSNADVGMTIAQLMGLRSSANGGLIGRVMSEALPNGIVAKAVDGTIVSKPAANGLKTIVKYQRVLSHRYFDAAGFAGRTVGLDTGQRPTENGRAITGPCGAAIALLSQELWTEEDARSSKALGKEFILLPKRFRSASPAPIVEYPISPAT